MAKTYHLFRSMDRANDYLKCAADNGGALGICATTPHNFMLDMAKMAGDERKVVDSVTRIAFLICSIEAIDDEELKSYFELGGMLSFLVEFVKRAAGCPTINEAIKVIRAEASLFSDYEEEVIELANSYYSMLMAYGFVELGTLAAEIPALLPARFDVVLHDDVDMLPAVKKCIEDVSNSFETSFKEIDYAEVFSKKRVELDVLSGERGAVQATFESIASHIDSNILILATDPTLMFEQVEPFVSEAGIDAQIIVNDKIQLGQTALGRGLIDAYWIYEDKDSRKSHIASLLHNPILDTSYFKTLSLEKRLRENDARIDTQIVEKLMDLSMDAESMLRAKAMAGTDITASLECMESIVSAEIKMSHAKRRCELSAIANVSSIYKALYSLGMSEPLWPDAYENLAFKNSFSCGKASASTQITIASIGTAKSLAPNSFDLVICADSTTNAFSAADKLDALDSLLDSLKIEKKFSGIKNARLDFCSLIETSKSDVVLMLPLRGIQSDADYYASAPLQEALFAISGCKFDIKKIKEIAEASNIRLAEFGEDGVYRSVGLSPNAADCFESREVLAPTFALNDITEFKDYIWKITDGTERPVLSPSSIERYCQCPYSWYLDYVVSHEPMDYEFNVMGLGTIAHEAFQLFYDGLSKRGIYRLKDFNDFDTYLPVFNDCFDAAIDNYFEIKNTNDISNVASVLDMLEINKLRKSCNDALAVQVMLPEDFVVTSHEYEIKPEAKLEYGGAVINGRIDRIDGNMNRDSFMIIDYKGSIKHYEAGYNGNPDDFALPMKTQALIYASLMTELTKKKCDGAIYVSYKTPRLGYKDSISGSISYEIDHLFDDMISKKCVVNCEMADYLSLVETAISKKIDDLADGKIAPNPLCADCCTYCKVKNCPKRL